MFRIISRDMRVVTSRNVRLLTEVSGLSPWDYSKQKNQQNLKKSPVPNNDDWRSGLLQKLLEKRRQSVNKDDQLDKMIVSLCTT